MPSGSGTSRSLVILRLGKFLLPWTEQVKTRSSSSKIAAVPTRLMDVHVEDEHALDGAAIQEAPRRDGEIVEDAVARSEVALRVVGAAREAAGDPVLHRRVDGAEGASDAAEGAQDHGLGPGEADALDDPAVEGAVEEALDVARVVNRVDLLEGRARAGRSSAADTIPSATSRSRSSPYLCMGKRCLGGSTTSKWSQ